MVRDLTASIAEILETPPVTRDHGDAIGQSVEGRAVRAFRFGHSGTRISLIGGCHADEPVGPRMLRHLCGYFERHDRDSLIRGREWWIVPHINPDGEERNRVWYGDDGDVCDIARYLTHVIRERPGDDIEFGFPRDGRDVAARPENRAVYDWWQDAAGPFDLHVSLHGMGFAAGPWFLIEPMWRDRCTGLKAACVERVRAMGYELHDVEREGEKGFVRLGKGFCTRPDSRAMQRHFHTKGDAETASLFRPSSMETVRALGGDPLTLVSEMPLFITPGVGKFLGPPDPVAEAWQARIARWREGVTKTPGLIRSQARKAGLVTMPIRDQMTLQLVLIGAGIKQVEQVFT